MTKRRGGGGFGGPQMPMGGGNQSGMMRQLQKMQEDMAKAQEALAEETLEVEAGGGAVQIVVKGDQDGKAVTVNPAAPDTNDPERGRHLQALLVGAIKPAITKGPEPPAGRLEAI